MKTIPMKKNLIGFAAAILDLHYQSDNVECLQEYSPSFPKPFYCVEWVLVRFVILYFTLWCLNTNEFQCYVRLM